MLEETRYVVGKLGITLPEIISGTQIFMGNEYFAVTVPGVIVFSAEPDQSVSSVRWWAHELQHIVQYRTLGVAQFASQYVKAYQSLEDEAEAKAKSV